jgi:signal transduction histidine kinase
MPKPDTFSIAVRDHGLGIPPEKREHIFERFYQAHGDGYRSGLGLGLYISSQIVELHGGRIAAEFPEDGGSRFVVRLPLAPEQCR